MNSEISKHYAGFRVSERLLFTGHSHQAWPDVSFEAQKQAWQDAAEHIDDKWTLAFQKADRFQTLLKSFFHDSSGEYVFGPNTQDLLIRFLSAYDLKKGLRILTTDGEFHSFRRLSQRLVEAGVSVTWVPANPVTSLTERLAKMVLESDFDLVFCSDVFFGSGLRLSNHRLLIETCAKTGTRLLMDVYHSAGNRAIHIDEDEWQDVYFVGGGYKYLQLGEGNCFLRIPRSTRFRPLITGWFAEFETLQHTPGQLAYPNGAKAFLGSTYDPTSHYRAVAVLEFFKQMGWTGEWLQQNYDRQTELIRERLLKEGVPSHLINLPLPENRGAFVTVQWPDQISHLEKFVGALRKQEVWVDTRGNIIRIGPAPYITEEQIERACKIFGGTWMTMAPRQGERTNSPSEILAP